MTQAAQAVFQQIVGGPGPHTFHRHLFTDAAGHDNEWNIEPPLLHESKRIARRKLRHGEVRQNEIRRLVEFAKEVSLRIDAPGGHLEPGITEHVEYQLRIIERVFE